MKKKLTFLLLIALLSPLLASAAANQYQMGDQMFTFRAGPVVPLFFYFPYDQDGVVTDTHLKTGGYGAIRYQGFLSNTLALGGEIGYYFAYPRSSDLYTTVPIQMLLSYLPVQGRFELPISLGVGFTYSSFAQSSYLGLFASLEIGFSWYFNENWGITLSGSYFLIPELYGKARREETSLASVMPIVLSVNYRH